MNQPTNHSCRVLVVEDDLHTRKILERMLVNNRLLRHLSIEVLCAADGREGLQQFIDHEPDLVITDLLMPEVDGFDFVAQLRRSPGGAELPILVTSAVFREKSNLRHLVEQYKVHFQPKPFSPRNIAQLVLSMLDAVGKAPAPREFALSEASAPLSAVTSARPREHVLRPNQRSGSLATTTISHLLLDALEQGLTGTIDLRRGGVHKRLYLLGGQPIFVRSNQRSETLGQLLLRRKKIADDQHNQVIAYARDKGLKYGESLIRLGLFSDQEVMEELAEQTRIKIAACLRWRGDRWDFTPCDESALDVMRCVVEPFGLILEGLARSFDIEDALIRMAQYEGARGELLLCGLDPYQQTYTEKFGHGVLSSIQSGRTLAELTSRPDFQNTVAQLDTLLNCGLLAFSEGPRLRAPSGGEPIHQPPVVDLSFSEPPELELSLDVPYETQPPPRIGAPPVSQTPRRRRMLSDELPVARQLIDHTYLTIHDSDHYSVLGVIPESDQASIEVAYQVKSAQFSLERYREVDLGESYSRLEEIIGRLKVAFDTLRDPLDRKKYDEQLAAERLTERANALEAEELFRQANQLLRTKGYADATKLLERACALDPQNDYLSHLALGRFYKQGPSEIAAQTALAEVAKILDHDPEQVAARLVAARISVAMGDADAAIDHLRKVLKADPSCREAFDEMAAVLLEQRRFDELEKEYRRTIHLLANRELPWARELWKRLVLLYANQLGSREKATLACRAALQLAPEDPELKQLLLRFDTRQSWPEEIYGFRALLAENPCDSASLQSLFELHHGARRVDAAFQVAAVAVLRGSATDRHREFVKQRRTAFLRRAAKRVSDYHTQGLAHPDDDPDLAAFFGAITPALRRRFHTSEIDNAVAPLGEDFTAVLRYVTQELSMARLSVVASDDLRKEVEAFDSHKLLVGTIAAASSDRISLCFRLARAAFLSAPGRITPLRTDATVLQQLLDAACANAPLTVDGQPFSIPDLDPLVERLLARTSKLPRAAEWQQGLRHSADRIALLLCGDVIAAGQILGQADPQALDDLIDYALSEQFCDARMAFGLALTG
ncbi:MAG: response regulator [Deltaproteobacteria bacterium]|nr:response regulator [Deltaproteobacteria bacterium]